MHRFRLLLAFAVLLAALLLFGTGYASSSSGPTRLLVAFKPTTSQAERNRALAASGADESATIPGIGVRVVTVSEGEASSVLVRLNANPGVEFAEADAVAAPAEVMPSDPSFPQTFAISTGAWGWYRTHTTEAWDITKGSPSVVVAILDTGLKQSILADFAGQVVPGWDVVKKSADTATYAGSHGSYTAGVVGLALDNGVGNAGFCPGCRIMPVQVGTDSNASVSDIASGLTWATDHGASVANISWETPTNSSTLQSAVNYARSHGVVVVAAAGNSNCDCKTYPAAHSGVLSVAATLADDTKASYSNFGSWVKLAAPGSVTTSWPVIGTGPGYAKNAGTSISAPVVAGIAGLLRSAKPSLTVTQVEQALQSTAVPVGFSLAYGRVDALAALNSIGFTDPQAPSVPVNLTPPEVRRETNGDWDSRPLTDAPQPGDVLVRGQGSWVGSAPLSLASVEWLRCTGSGPTCTVAGTGSTYTVLPSDAGAAFKLAVTVKNSLGSTKHESAASLRVPGAPTAVAFTAFSAARGASGAVVRWQTGSEAGTLGFNVYRGQGAGRVRLNRTLVPARGGAAGHSYSFRDRHAPAGAARYWVEAVGAQGARSVHGPARVSRR